jgi:hypothetical protein
MAGGAPGDSARGNSDINLFRYRQCIVDLDAEMPDRAFDLGMPEQELDGPEISCPPIDQIRVAFVRRSERVPNSLRSGPTLPIQSDRPCPPCGRYQGISGRIADIAVGPCSPYSASDFALRLKCKG